MEFHKGKLGSKPQIRGPLFAGNLKVVTFVDHLLLFPLFLGLLHFYFLFFVGGGEFPLEKDAPGRAKRNRLAPGVCSSEITWKLVTTWKSRDSAAGWRYKDRQKPGKGFLFVSSIKELIHLLFTSCRVDFESDFDQVKDIFDSTAQRRSLLLFLLAARCYSVWGY